MTVVALRELAFHGSTFTTVGHHSLTMLEDNSRHVIDSGEAPRCTARGNHQLRLTQAKASCAAVTSRCLLIWKCLQGKDVEVGAIGS